MALDPDKLRSKLTQAAARALQINSAEPGSPPNIPRKVAELYASAYHSYALDAMAGPLKISLPPIVDTLSQALTAPMFAGWSSGLSAYWSPVVWAGPGFIPANPMQPASVAAASAALSSGMPAIVSAPQSTDVFVSRLTSLLHSATVALQVVSTTTSVPPLVAPLPVI